MELSVCGSVGADSGICPASPSVPHYTLRIAATSLAQSYDAVVAEPQSAPRHGFVQVLDSASFVPFLSYNAVDNKSDGMEAVEEEEFVLLGRGVSAVVEKMVRKEDGKVVAVKHIEAVGKQQTDAISRELFVAEQRLKLAMSPRPGSDADFLVDHYGAFSTADGASIVMEIMAGSFGGLPAMPEHIVAPVAKMFLRGLRFMHEDLHVMHRDLKPSNLLFDADGMLKITDFGLSTRLESMESTTGKHVGSMMFLSPERLRGEDYGFAGDVFSFGVTIAQLLLGQHPLTDSLGDDCHGPYEARFWGLVGAMGVNDGLDASVAATESSFRAVLEGRCSPCMLEFVLRCVHADPCKRPTCAELLLHGFIGGAAGAACAPSADHGDSPTTERPLARNDTAAGGTWTDYVSSRDGDGDSGNGGDQPAWRGGVAAPPLKSHPVLAWLLDVRASQCDKR
jgi:serine/threonine protein kinase